MTNNNIGIEILSPSTVVAKNSIVSDNFQGGTPYDIFGLLSSASIHNLFGSGGSGGMTNSAISLDGRGNIVLPSGQTARLKPLGYYGGTTKTHVLFSNSPAIDAGYNSVATAFSLYDQRNQNRIVDWNSDGSPNNVDIGAVELALGELYS